MRRSHRHRDRPLQRLALTLVALALLVRVAVPAGFMPTGGGRFAVMVCSGMNMPTAPAHAHSMTHKGEPAPAKSDDRPCAFAGSGAAWDAAQVATPDSIALRPTPAPQPPRLAVTIGQGLAAPPPPPTGPPAFA